MVSWCANGQLVITPPCTPTCTVFANMRIGLISFTEGTRFTPKKYAQAQEWCKANGVMEYVETSAKSGEGVERAFLEVAERIYQNIEAGRYDLNDRRSGVKGPGGGANRAGVNLNDASKKGKQQGWGSCC